MATFLTRSIDTELVSRDSAQIYDFQYRRGTSLLSTLNCQYLYSDNCVIYLKEFYFWRSEFFQDVYEFERRNNIKKEKN